VRPFYCPYIQDFHPSFSDTIIGQGSLLLLPLSCSLKAVFLVNSRPPRFYAPCRVSFSLPYWDILPSSLRIILLWPLYSLLAYLRQIGTVFLKAAFPDSIPLLFPSFLPFQGSWLRGCFLLLLRLSGQSLFLILSLLIFALSLSIFYELFCYPFSSPSFGAGLSHLNSRRSPTLLMHCYVFS